MHDRNVQRHADLSGARDHTVNSSTVSRPRLLASAHTALLALSYGSPA